MTEVDPKKPWMDESNGSAEELIRVETGRCSGPRRANGPGTVLVVVNGKGSALAGDIWLEVGPGARIEVDGGDACALRADRSEPVVGVFLRGRRIAGMAA